MLIFVVLPNSLLAKKFISQKNRVTLVELFTSEGCSSCPPAEKQMNALIKNSDLWKKYVPIAFHVDYWNDLGWTDPFSQSQFSQRQRNYATAWKVDTTYTPAFVNNGKSVKSRIKLGDKGLENPEKTVPKLELNLQNLQKATLKVTGLHSQKRYEAHIAILGNGFVTKVPTGRKGGENAGETLKHNFVVLNYQKTSIKSGAASFILRKQKTLKKPKSRSVAVWVTTKGGHVPIQSVGGHL